MASRYSGAGGLPPPARQCAAHGTNHATRTPHHSSSHGSLLPLTGAAPCAGRVAVHSTSSETRRAARGCFHECTCAPTSQAQTPAPVASFRRPPPLPRAPPNPRPRSTSCWAHSWRRAPGRGHRAHSRRSRPPRCAKAPSYPARPAPTRRRTTPPRRVAGVGHVRPRSSAGMLRLAACPRQRTRSARWGRLEAPQPPCPAHRAHERGATMLFGITVSTHSAAWRKPPAAHDLRPAGCTSTPSHPTPRLPTASACGTCGD